MVIYPNAFTEHQLLTPPRGRPRQAATALIFVFSLFLFRGLYLYSIFNRKIGDSTFSSNNSFSLLHWFFLDVQDSCCMDFFTWRVLSWIKDFFTDYHGGVIIIIDEILVYDERAKFYLTQLFLKPIFF